MTVEEVAIGVVGGFIGGGIVQTVYTWMITSRLNHLEEVDRRMDGLARYLTSPAEPEELVGRVETLFGGESDGRRD